MIIWAELQNLAIGAKVRFNEVDYVFEMECGGDYYQFNDGISSTRIFVDDLLAFGEILS